MASYTAVFAKEQTLSSTTVDTITLSGAPAGGGTQFLTIYNQHASNWMYVTWGATSPSNPTAGGDDCIPVPPASGTTVRLSAALTSTGANQGLVVKIIGNGNKYNVVALPG